ncbi:MAG: hypothetical protein FRX49_07261 [Trebouxia sp. A1-2]|nr:MAG: hypothetical protein FRX49_07261 [Trebouxia sp. A1-2]
METYPRMASVVIKILADTKDAIVVVVASIVLPLVDECEALQVRGTVHDCTNSRGDEELADQICAI